MKIYLRNYHIGWISRKPIMIRLNKFSRIFYLMLAVGGKRYTFNIQY